MPDFEELTRPKAARPVQTLIRKAHANANAATRWCLNVDAIKAAGVSIFSEWHVVYPICFNVFWIDLNEYHELVWFSHWKGCTTTFFAESNASADDFCIWVTRGRLATRSSWDPRRLGMAEVVPLRGTVGISLFIAFMLIIPTSQNGTVAIQNSWFKS